MNAIVKTTRGLFFLIGTFSLGVGLVLENFSRNGSTGFFCLAILLLGSPIGKNVLKEMIDTGDFQVDLLMILSAIGAVAIGYFSEAAILLFIFAASEVLEDYVYQKSMATMESLMTQVPKQANVLRSDGQVELRDIEEIQLYDVLVVAKGQQIALDGKAQEPMLIDESLLTGESLPVIKEKGDQVFAGTLNIGDTATYQVTKESSESRYAQIVSLIQAASSSQGKRDQRIHQLQKKYVILVLVGVIAFIVCLMAVQKQSFTESFYRGMILLTVASPCALIASITPAMLSAMSFGAKNGMLIKSGQVLENMMELSILCTDKTGTLTRGEFRINDYQLENAELLPLLLYMESRSAHPLATSILAHFKDIPYRAPESALPVKEHIGYGIQMGDIVIGNQQFVQSCTDPQGYLTKESYGTMLFVAQKNRIVGFIELVDTLRDEARETVAALRQSSIEVVMLTGDRREVAQSVAEQLQIETVHAQCLPEDKVACLKEYAQEGHVVGMIGDGLNDAPILAHADIGIAMGGGTDVALEMSDVIIIHNHLTKVNLLCQLSRKYGKITRFNIVFSIAVILFLIVLNFMGILDLTKGVFFHEVSTILVILNGLRLLK
ncbi:MULTISPECIES: heavy metal translocating P-type ATPase [unclassified Streptococcus]|uniref:heavy metal translocating P-type ATPase n=1 Tax=unclassified Streptococcus TaxID=2608887 RepID=UPI001072D8F9|nr:MULTISPECIES: heavy metal translocating P-type ATPase [unclassified Streptococcus]MBF0786524.1 heavy metal translocating P-type ATPase [Streptococcus sp. 19428wC2_LYSM12]MCQ9212320.1 heavy metal translocating P-type ATPase [Streptococcus sp. B01]MCQ9213651.1 heavy metal translocating P-type ATPase [Streptococcus sp. O1]TFV06686.1 heavy metal translocating P-type ATPase [Streptococcus sp. LYSM12]